MAEVFVQFEAVVISDDGVKYHARACGGAMPDGLWEGWVEFVPVDGGTRLRSPRETTQPNRRDALYWATGLTPVYLAGSLERAFEAGTPRSKSPEHTAYTQPPRAILDPYAAYEKGEMLMRQELHALSRMHLVNIIRAYGLSDESDAALGQLSSEDLVDTVVSAVRRTATR